MLAHVPTPQKECNHYVMQTCTNEKGKIKKQNSLHDSPRVKAIKAFGYLTFID